MNTCALLRDSMYKTISKRNVLDSLLMSDGSMGNDVIGTMQLVVNQ